MNEQERIEILRKIKGYKEPPFLKDDAYYSREPWRKFGGISSGIYMGWFWYRDDFILSNVTDNDLMIALKEIERLASE